LVRTLSVLVSRMVKLWLLAARPSAKCSSFGRPYVGPFFWPLCFLKCRTSRSVNQLFFFPQVLFDCSANVFGDDRVRVAGARAAARAGVTVCFFFIYISVRRLIFV
jgi:hypothetical protein